MPSDSFEEFMSSLDGWKTLPFQANTYWSVTCYFNFQLKLQYLKNDEIHINIRTILHGFFPWPSAWKHILFCVQLLLPKIFVFFQIIPFLFLSVYYFYWMECLIWTKYRVCSIESRGSITHFTLCKCVHKAFEIEIWRLKPPLKSWGTWYFYSLHNKWF